MTAVAKVYVALKKLGKAPGAVYMPGELVPEAANWRTRGSLIARGQLAELDKAVALFFAQKLLKGEGLTVQPAATPAPSSQPEQRVKTSAPFKPTRKRKAPA